MIRPAKNTPWPERVGKRIRHLGVWLGDCFARGGQAPPVVLAYPNLPSRRTTLHKVCRANRWELTNVPRKKPLFSIRFEDATVKSEPMPEGVKGLVWNEGCLDISKRTLDQNHLEIFGYGVSIDPLSHKGILLEKSNGNAAHDGQERMGPLSTVLPDKVYQRIIDNRDERGWVMDLRLVYVCGLTPVTYRKFKSDAARYSNETTEVTLAETDSCFSPSELKGIQRLMDRMGVDVAELDILRDRSTNQMFVVDVNPTPWGPPAGLDSMQAKLAISEIAAAFQASLTGERPSK